MMKPSVSAFLVAAALGFAAGCVGDVTDADPPVDPTDPLPQENNPGNNTGNNPAGNDLSAAKALYDTNVYPVMMQKCGSSGCHGETGQVSSPIRFVTAEVTNAWQVATSFTALVANFTYDAAPILTKVTPGNHYGATYTAAETQAITDWLNKEVELRNTIGGGGGGSGSGSGSGSGTPTGESLSAATQRVLSAYRGCMIIPGTPSAIGTEFAAADMADAWGGLNAQNNQECENCHATGGEGFIASRDDQFMWNVFSTQKYYFLQYLTVNLVNGPEAAEVIINNVSFRGVANGQDPHREHPRFNANDNQGMQALSQFHEAIKAKMAAGQCGAPAAFPMN